MDPLKQLQRMCVSIHTRDDGYHVVVSGETCTYHQELGPFGSFSAAMLAVNDMNAMIEQVGGLVLPPDSKPH